MNIPGTVVAPFINNAELDQIVNDSIAARRFQTRRFSEAIYSVDQGLNGKQRKEQLYEKLQTGIEILTVFIPLHKNQMNGSMDAVERLHRRMKRDQERLYQELGYSTEPAKPLHHESKPYLAVNGVMGVVNGDGQTRGRYWR
jgi:hypothetical protein